MITIDLQFPGKLEADIMKISGVYKIINTITGDFYIGSSKNIEQRWHSHRKPSIWALYPRVKLYQAFIKYGLDSFTFSIIEETNDLRVREQYWMDQLKPSYNNYRAKEQNTERFRNTNKAWYETHREEYSAKSKAYYNRLCAYKGEILTLRALSKRLSRRGVQHSTLEAKKYLI